MSSKTKNIILIAGFILALFLCYHFAVKNTLQEKQRYNKLKAEEVMFENIPKQLLTLNKKNEYYTGLLKKYQLGETSLQNNLLKTINKKAGELNLKVIDFNEPHIARKNGLNINTYTITLQGSFNNMIKLIYSLEQQTRFGELVNVHFIKQKNYRTRREYLQATIMLQAYL
ncbi:hypothetical protein [Abyssalbus ytuae]|uniref:Uncharacterized protein n=1 Tax=Abyssalbus ytuae TaxID=2926907 RepID=A0A9E6ZLB0_9FLAO|nr:hypothetical protein [Abyssalbus ytuae]UOB17879.1 hypothetical protein MQE35_00950 [Abyssalbus ytuae]